MGLSLLDRSADGALAMVMLLGATVGMVGMAWAMVPLPHEKG